MDPKKVTIIYFYQKKIKPYDIVKKHKALNIRERKIYRTCAGLRQGQSIDN